MRDAMEPYVIRQGDFVALLAYEKGFDADTVWNDPANDDLRNSRQNPNVLAPTDILYIPPAKAPTAFPLTTGTTNTFVSSTPTVPVEIRFMDSALASQAFTCPEIPELTGKSTDSDGTAKFDVPVNIGAFTVLFTSSGTSLAFRLGHLDPVDSLSGIFQRLQNLGYIPREVDIESADFSSDLEPLRLALRRFRDDQQDPNASSGDPSPLPPAYGGLDDKGILEVKSATLLAKVHGS
jgi:hypothetical protein